MCVFFFFCVCADLLHVARLWPSHLNGSIEQFTAMLMMMRVKLNGHIDNYDHKMAIK